MTTSTLDVDEDIGYERRSWLIHRVAWSGLSLLLAAAAAGLLGEGPSNRRAAATPDATLRVLYEKVLRHNAETMLRVTLRSDVAAGGVARLTVGDEWMASMKLARVDPEPLSVRAVPGGHEFEFRSAGGDFDAAFVGEPRSFGPVEVRLSAGPRPPLTFRQLILP